MNDKQITPNVEGRGFRMGNASTSYDISVGEGVIGRRIFAYLIDVFILWMAAIALGFIGFMTFGLLTPLLVPIGLLMPLAYHSLMIASSKSATIGQQAMGLRVMTQSGRKVELLQAVILTALFYASLAFTGGLILLWCLFDDKQRCLHDILAGTLLVRMDRETTINNK